MQEPNGSEAAASQKDDLIGQVVAGRYRIERRLGQGGMGTVYRAIHEALRKPVAIKLLSEGAANKEVAARFEREAVASANLRHPNIAEATDFGRLPDGSLFLVMEYVAGETLRSIVEASPRGLPVDRALRILGQIASALSFAHGRDVVHRDLKPDNVIVFERGGERDAVKLIDFGIARIRSAMLGAGQAALTVQGAVFGTPEYMAPEQVLGEAADARADQYAFGITAFELLTGRVPYSEADVSRVLMKHVGAPIPDVLEAAPHLPPAVSGVLAKLLGKRPAERYATLAEAFSALEAALGSAPLAAPSAAEPVPSGGTVKMSSPAVSAARIVEQTAPPPAGDPSPGALPVRARPPARTAQALAGEALLAVKSKPLLLGGAALGGLMLLVLVIVLVARGGSSVPPDVADALDQWEDGAYSAAGPTLKAELGKSASLAIDPEVVRVVAGAVHSGEGRSALRSLLDESRLGRSPIMAAALSEVALGEPGAPRNGALKLLRGRLDLLAAEPRARVAYRDADDCAAMEQALSDLAAAAAPLAKEDLDRHPSRCAEVIRRDELCTCPPRISPRPRKGRAPF